MRILGIDPGFASVGWCVGDYDGSHLAVLELDCISTRKDKRRVLQCDDNVRRLRHIEAEIRHTIHRNGVHAVAVEAMSFPRNASAAVKIALCWGMISTVTSELGLPLIQRSPQEIKTAVVGSTSASKHAMATKLMGDYPETVDMLEDVSPSRQEHPIDALGAIVACLGSEVIKASVGRIR